MTYVLSISALTVLSFALSTVLVKSMIIVMPKLNIVDRPSNRRAHVGVTPTAGGFTLVIIFCINLPIFEYLIFDKVESSLNILKVFIPIALVSFWDDISEIPVLLRLFTHTLCAIIAIMWFIQPYKILHIKLPLIIDFLIGTFALITFLNFYNFLDGIDGITASQSIHLSFTILILCFIKHEIIPNIWLVTSVASIILGWSCSFILFNWQPAKIFPGDVGSVTLGFLLGICLLIVATASEQLFVSCRIASLYYIADGGITIIIRLINKEKIWEPHLQHFFQKAVKKGMSHKQIVSKIIKCNLMLMLFAVGALFYPITCIILGIWRVRATLTQFIK